MQGENSKPAIVPKQELDQICASECSRESAKSILARKIDQGQNEINGLRSLYAALPDSMGPGAEEALYKLIQAALPNQRFS